jgi:hypothetical protein
MKKKKDHVKLVHEGNYVAEVDIKLIDSGEGWTPYLSLEDAEKLDRVREALRKDDISTANKLARVYRLTPVTH